MFKLRWVLQARQYLACKTHLGHATRARTHPIPGVTRVKAAVPSFQVLPEKGWGGVPAPLTDTRVSNRLKSNGHSLVSPISNSLGFKWRKGGPHLFFLGWATSLLPTSYPKVNE